MTEEFLIRYVVSNNDTVNPIYETLLTTSTPTVLFNNQSNTSLRYGSYKDIIELYNQYYNTFKEAGLYDIADALVIMSMPKDQDLIDQMVNSIDYAGRFYDKYIKKGDIQNAKLNS